MEIFGRPLMVSSRAPLKLGTRCLRRYASAGTLRHPIVAAPHPFKPRVVRFPFHISAASPYEMPATIISRRHFSPDPMTNPFSTSDAAMKDATPLLNFEDGVNFESVGSESDQMIFGPLDFDEGTQYASSIPFAWDPYNEFDSHSPISHMPGPPSSISTQFDANVSHTSPHDTFLDSGAFSGDGHASHDFDDGNFYLSHWLNEPDLPAMQSSSSPIPIRSATMGPQSPSPFVPYSELPLFPQDASFSPAEFAALHPLPRSASPLPSFEDHTFENQHFDSISPQEMSLQPPAWASHLWESPSYLRPAASSRASARPSPLSENTLRQRFRRDSLPVGQIFQSSSAPSMGQIRPPSQPRSYSRRAESVSVSDDRDATVRRKKRIPVYEEPRTVDKASEGRAYSPAVIRAL